MVRSSGTGIRGRCRGPAAPRRRRRSRRAAGRRGPQHASAEVPEARVRGRDWSIETSSAARQVRGHPRRGAPAVPSSRASAVWLDGDGAYAARAAAACPTRRARRRRRARRPGRRRRGAGSRRAAAWSARPGGPARTAPGCALCGIVDEPPPMRLAELADLGPGQHQHVAGDPAARVGAPRPGRRRRRVTGRRWVCQDGASASPSRSGRARRAPARRRVPPARRPAPGRPAPPGRRTASARPAATARP